MKEYRAIVFDLFDTIVDFEPQKMPVVLLDGREIRTTSGKLFDILSKYYKQVEFASFYRAWMEVLQEIRDEVELTHKEITAPKRFLRVLSKLSLPDGLLSQGLFDELLHAHTEMLAAATSFPEERRDILLCLKKRYRLGMVSNFDYAPTVHRILSMYSIEDLFEAIVISAEMGIRKPMAQIFQKALEAIGSSPAESLFVGDTFGADVIGAKMAGMDAAWIDRGLSPAHPSGAEPDFKLRDFKELLNILCV